MTCLHRASDMGSVKPFFIRPLLGPMDASTKYNMLSYARCTASYVCTAVQECTALWLSSCMDVALPLLSLMSQG
jgi:hypothetical protein